MRVFFSAQMVRGVVAGLALAWALMVAGCGGVGGGKAAANSARLAVEDSQRVLADFEKPLNVGTEIRWEPLTIDSQAATEPAVQPMLAGNEATTAPASEPAGPPVLARSSIRPQSGLWSELVHTGLAGAGIGEGGSLIVPLSDGPSHPLDLGAYTVVAAQVMHLGNNGDNGEWIAAIALTDAGGKRVEGDSFAVMANWDEVTIDLKEAFEQGLDISRISDMRVVLRRAAPHRESDAPSTAPASEPEDSGLDIQSDHWVAQKRGKNYLGDRLKAGSFFVTSDGTRLRIGTAGQYELTLCDRGISAADNGAKNPFTNQQPWMQVEAGGKTVMGSAGTGLMLLDADALDQIRAGGPLRRGPDNVPGMADAVIPAMTWPVKKSESRIAESRWTWEVAWTSPVGAIIEVVQETGPYDRRGEPAAIVKWRLMVYQWGQVFVHAQWTMGGMDGALGGAGPGGMPQTFGAPASWALVLNEDVLDRSLDSKVLISRDSTQDAAPGAGGGPSEEVERLLSAMYPASVRDALQTALPHQMQSGAPVAMIAKTLDSTGSGMAKDAWWWARGFTQGETSATGLSKKVFGAGIRAARPAASSAETGEADCMLLVNAPDIVKKAGAFGQYLVPPKVITRQGELDRNFPGDAENDGFVEAYGFQVVRLAGGRATFTIYPQNRPVLYPVYLFTVPAVERDALDVKHARVLINIDGKQFADPPQFPDGSFLLQVPLALDLPVTVEARLEKK